VASIVRADEDLGPRFPDLVGTVRGVLERLREEPVTVTASRGGQELSVVVGAYDVQAALAQALADAGNLAGMPAAVDLMDRGVFDHMLGFALRNRFGELGPPMGYLMDCASGASEARAARIARELDDPQHVLGDGLAAPFHLPSCAAAGDVDLGEDFREPFACDVPTLFVSGELDPRTPPANVEALAPGFSEHAHVVVTNTGHGERELESPEYRALVAAFLRGEPVASTTIELPPVAFRPLMER